MTQTVRNKGTHLQLQLSVYKWLFGVIQGRKYMYKLITELYNVSCKIDGNMDSSYEPSVHA